jgi:hypothetical protein
VGRLPVEFEMGDEPDCVQSSMSLKLFGMEIEGRGCTRSCGLYANGNGLAARASVSNEDDGLL